MLQEDATSILSRADSTPLSYGGYADRAAFLRRLVAVAGLVTGVILGVILFTVLPNKEVFAERLGNLRNQIALALGSSPKSVLYPTAELEVIVLQASRTYRIEPELVWAMIAVESSFQRYAQSHKGAQGFMQLMPATARSVGIQDVHSPRENIFGGARYLRRPLDRYDNNYHLALAAYNAGPGAVDKYKGIPPFKETKGYVRKVLKLYEAEKAKRFQLLR